MSQDSTQSVYAVNFLANGVSVLHFQSLQKNQTGQYTCIVLNSRGSGSSSVSVYGMCSIWEGGSRKGRGEEARERRGGAE